MLNRILRAAVVAALVVVPLTFVGGTAQAAACSARGVTVVVQFPDNHIEVGCAAGDPANGVAALNSAGFSVGYDPQNPGFVCKIKGAPADGDCMGTTAYWGYFHAAGNGQRWRYSSTGAGGYNPAPGTCEGWAFGGGSAPRTLCRVAAAQVAPVHSTKPKPKPTTSASATPSPSASASPSPTGTASPTKPAKPKKLSSVQATPLAENGATASASPVAAADSATTGTDAGESSSSSTLPWIAAIGAIAVFGAGAVVLSRRRG